MDEQPPEIDLSRHLVVTDRLTVPLAEFRFEFSRSGGPGGQNVNKVNSKATLRWFPAQSASLPPAVKSRLLDAVGSRLTREGELLVTSQLTRDQGRNVEDCLNKLRAMLESVARPPRTRRPTKPTMASQVRRVESKQRRSETKRLRKRLDND